MKKLLLLCFAAVLFLTSAFSQKQNLDYFLPATVYDPAIPTPESFLGYQVGEWHVSHDQLVAYMKALAAASPRIQIEEYARSHEGRPLLLLTITSEKNQQRIEEIQTEHLRLSDPAKAKGVAIENMPAVVYQGYSIHGNESSGANAALLMAYHLAAGQSEAVKNILENVVILLDPCFNPDGMNRFSTWVNMHKSKTLVTDPASREFHEVWPGGRTNHYWFDLNRDWLLLVHPESQGRIRNFYRWKPNILTDHHEMGSNSTFFFQPGVASRVNPLTPLRNQELTTQIGRFHAAALDEIGSLYYSGESFDDFYYGKGSTYPDVNACVGILFEQASSRGHLQETANGLLSFSFTIRNQVRTSLSTLQAATQLRKELLVFQKDFYQTAATEAQKDDVKAFVFESKDEARLIHFLQILQQHKIEVFPLTKDVRNGDQVFAKENAFIVPTAQNQYRLVKAIFDTSTSFSDSLFYDVSTWTLPLAFDLNYSTLLGGQYQKNLCGDSFEAKLPEGKLTGATTAYGYLFDWGNYYAPKALYSLQAKGLRVKMANATLEMVDGKNKKQFNRGAVFVPAQNQNRSPEDLRKLMQEVARESHLEIFATAGGAGFEGIDLGSPQLTVLQKPEVLLLTGNGVSAYDAGEVWHLLDTRYEMPLSMSDADGLENLNLDRYNTIVMADGSYGSISKSGEEALKSWLEQGGTLIAMERAVQWVAGKNLAGVSFRKAPEDKRIQSRRPYGNKEEDSGAEVIGGAIFRTQLDLTHPLCYGFEDAELPVFRQGKIFMELPQNVYASPVVYEKSPLLSGYISEENLKQLSGSAVVVVSRLGRGRVICIADNPNFRGFWYGTNRLFANAMFLGNTISGSASEGVGKE